jgi:ribosomal-protein-alanine N-acetyltransferase
MLSEPLGFPMEPIATPRLILRRMTLHDAPDIFEYSRDPEVARHVLWDAHRSVSDSKAYVRFMIRKYRMGEPASWGIQHREDGKLIGTIGYMWHQPEHRSAEVGYSLSRAYWNQGLMTEALRAVIAYSFEDLMMNRLEAQHEVSNPASGAVMRKAGMRSEGVLRERLYNKGRYVDVALYAILRSEYAGRSSRA